MFGTLAALPPAQVQRSCSELAGRIVLADGHAVDMRPVIARDAVALQTLMRGLSAASRQMRFHIGIRELPPDLLRAMTEVDQRRHVAVVAEVPQMNGTVNIVAEARYVRGTRPGEAEFAVTVADAWQGAGLGRALLQRLLRHARRRGVTRWVGDVLHANLPMMSLVQSMGGHFVAVPDAPTLLRAVFDMSAEGADAPAGADHARTLSNVTTLLSNAPASRMRTALACGSR